MTEMVNSKADVYRDLRQRIIAGELAPGLVLAERDLTERYGVSRTPLREVLWELERDMLVTRVPRSGTFVTSLDLAQLREVIEIRLDLEELAGRLAAERITPTQLAGMRRALAEMEAGLQSPDSQRSRISFSEHLLHETVYRATDNRELYAYLTRLYGVCARFWIALKFEPQEVAAEYRDFKELVEALEARDGQRAGAIMSRHLSEFLVQVRGKILG